MIAPANEDMDNSYGGPSRAYNRAEQVQSILLTVGRPVVARAANWAHSQGGLATTPPRLQKASMMLSRVPFSCRPFVGHAHRASIDGHQRHMMAQSRQRGAKGDALSVLVTHALCLASSSSCLSRGPMHRPPSGTACPSRRARPHCPPRTHSRTPRCSRWGVKVCAGALFLLALLGGGYPG